MVKAGAVSKDNSDDPLKVSLNVTRLNLYLTFDRSTFNVLREQMLAYMPLEM